MKQPITPTPEASLSRADYNALHELADLAINGEQAEQVKGGIVKTGGGTLVLTSNNTYTGSTTVNAGTLR